MRCASSCGPGTTCGPARRTISTFLASEAMQQSVNQFTGAIAAVVTPSP